MAKNVETLSKIKKGAKDLKEWSASKGVGAMVKYSLENAPLVGLNVPLVGLYDAGTSILGKLLSYDWAQIESIRKKIPDRRIVVLIDDLDRCSPELIPKLLLMLRELLDRPGFTFLLAFDDEIVGASLAMNNPAWSNGSDFLDKILDFRFHLPPVTDIQKRKLLKRALNDYCPFIPSDSTNAVEDLLPSNPRKLKSLVRNIAALKPQIDRHDDELSWVDIWLAQLLRMESSAFFELLLSGENLAEVSGLAYELKMRLAKQVRFSDNEELHDPSLALAEKAGVTDKASVERIVKLVNAVRARSGDDFRYVAQLALKPHVVTGKELQLLFVLWTSNRQITV